MENQTEKPWLTLYADRTPQEVEGSRRSGSAIFQRWVREDPDATMLRYFGDSLTVREVDELTSSLAQGLEREFGVRRGDRVAAQLQNVPAFPIVLLAAWKLGAIFVPVNPMLKGQELSFLLGDSGAKVLFCLSSLIPGVRPAVAATIGEERLVDVPDRHLAPSANHPLMPAPSEGTAQGERRSIDGLINRYAGQTSPGIDLSSDETALLSYTSGTTGRSKGAANTHANVAANAANLVSWFDLGGDDAVADGAPLFHITGMMCQLLTAIQAQVPLVLTYRFDTGVFADYVEAERCTFAVMAITGYIALKNAGIDRSQLASLTKAYSGGAPVAQSVVEDFRAKYGIYIRNAYGLTEATSATHIVPRDAEPPFDEDSGALSVGVPISGTDAKIVDESGDRLGPGEVGELLVRGPQIIPEYWERPDETEIVFADGWLKTGDVGLMDQDGWFFVIDRKKDMIIASGYKVWPRDVEDVLYEHPAVSEAAVVGIPDEYRGETVKAFVTLRPGAAVSDEELIDFCRSSLAAYKYPRHVEIVDELPKTPTGKIMRRSLRDA